MTIKNDQQLSDLARRFFGAEASKWFGIASLLSFVFCCAITVTNWARTVFGFQLLPYFEPGFDAYLVWSHWVLDILIFQWVEALSEFAFNGVADVIVSWFGTPIPHFELSIPSWWKDASLVSFLLLRSQNASKKLSHPVSLHLMTDAEKKEWDGARAFASRVGGAIEGLLWSLVIAVFSFASWIVWPIKKILGTYVGKLCRDTVGGTLLLGILYLAHDLVLAFNTRNFRSAQANAHRRFVLLMSASLLAAFFASIAFLFGNGAFAKPPMTG